MNFSIFHLVMWFIVELLLITIVFTALFRDSNSPITREIYYTLKFTFLTLGLWYILGLGIIGTIHNHIVKDSKEGMGLSDLICFRDENGKVKFSVNRSDFLYIESADNYIMIFYLFNEEVKKELLRNTLKKIEPDVRLYNVVRCHRSFMVNLQNVILVRKEGRSYVLKLRQINRNIPVSRNFIPKFKELLRS